mgnify:CR=1 FL=1
MAATTGTDTAAETARSAITQRMDANRLKRTAVVSEWKGTCVAISQESKSKIQAIESAIEKKKKIDEKLGIVRDDDSEAEEGT